MRVRANVVPVLGTLRRHTLVAATGGESPLGKLQVGVRSARLIAAATPFDPFRPSQM